MMETKVKRRVVLELIPQPEENYDYYGDLKIDQFNLEVECLDQPRRFMKYAELYAQSVFDRDKAKQDLKVVIAETALRIRRSEPKMYDLDKFTEATIQALIDTDMAVKAAEAKLIEANGKLEFLRSAKDAFFDRKQELINLIALTRAMYFSDPNPEASRELKNRQEFAKSMEKEVPF